MKAGGRKSETGEKAKTAAWLFWWSRWWEDTLYTISILISLTVKRRKKRIYNDFIGSPAKGDSQPGQGGKQEFEEPFSNDVIMHHCSTDF